MILLLAGRNVSAQNPNVGNSDFETPNLNGAAFQYGVLTGPGQPWIFGGASGVAANRNSSDIGVTGPTYGQFGFIQNAGGSCSQLLSFGAGGIYEVRYLEAGRNQNQTAKGDLTYEVSVISTDPGATALFSRQRTTTTAQPFRTVGFQFVIPTAGDYYLKFEGKAALNGDDMAAFDNVEVIIPTTLLVTSNADDGSVGTLRWAISAASSGNTIAFDMTQVVSPIATTSGLVIDKNLIISGPASPLTLLGQGGFNILSIGDGLTASISNLGIARAGASRVGRGINNGNGSSATITNCTITGNTTGIANTDDNTFNASMTVSNCTLNNNSTAISNFRIMTVSNCTLSGNGRAIFGNTTHVNNSICAGNSLENSTGAFIDDGYNLISTTAIPINPMLTALQDNGGPTQTMLPLLGSPAIDQGNSTLATDQRGYPRPIDLPSANVLGGNSSDIGAVEANYTITPTAGTPQSVIVNTAFPTQLTATVAESGRPLSGISVAFSGPSTGPRGTFASTGNATETVVSDATGAAVSSVFSANGTVGSYVVTAAATGIGSAAFSLTNDKGTAQVNLSSLTQTYDGSPKSVNVSTTPSGLTVNITYDGSSTSPTAAGTYSAVAVVDDANYEGQASGTFTISKANQIITFGAIADSTYGDPDFQVNATTDSGLAVTFSATGNATVAGNTVHITGAGSATVTASQAGDNNYNQASLARGFNIAKATAVVNWSNPADITYGAALGGVELNATSSVAGTLTYSPGSATVLNAGAGQILSVTFAPTDSANYGGASKSVSINVLKADQAITFGALGSKTYGDAPFDLSAASSSALTVGFSLVSGPATINGKTVTMTAPGTVTVRASQAGDGNYNAAPAVDQSFQVAKAGTTVSLASNASPSRENDDVTFTATIGSNVSDTRTGTVQFYDNGTALGSAQSVNSGGVATLSIATLTVGTHVITANYSGDATFSASYGSVSQRVKSCAITVINNGDSGAGSLRQALLDICAGGTISFDPILNGQTIVLTSAELAIDGNVTITGPGPDLLTVSGNNARRVFNIGSVNAGRTVAISGLTISNGSEQFGGGIYNPGGTTLTLTAVTITMNTASIHGGGIYNDTPNVVSITASSLTGNSAGNGGGGIFNSGGTVNILNSTMNGNSAGHEGGAMFTHGQANIVNSTLSGNSTTGGGNGGGGAFIGSPRGVVNLINSTVTGNVANTVSPSEGGGGINNHNDLNSGNSIIAGNTAPTAGGPDVLNSLTSQGYNLIGNSSGVAVTSNTGDQIGTSQSPIDPSLGPLQNNGGPAFTHAPLPGSRVIDKGKNLGSTALDQRGNPRPVRQDAAITLPTGGDGSDIGAIEVFYEISATGGAPQSATINTAFGTALETSVTESGNLASGIPVTFTAPSIGASANFGNSLTATVTTSSGVATAPGPTANGTAGNYTVLASLTGIAPPAAFDLTNLKADQTITFGAISTKTYEDPDVTVSATSSSGLPVTFTAAGDAMIVNGNTVHITGAGSATITASQSGDGNYNAAPSVSQTFTINKATAGITLGNLSQTYDGSAKAASETTNPAGKTVILSYTQNGITVPSPTNAGSYDISAIIDDANYQGSTTGSLVINKATPVISWSNPSDITYGTALSGTQLNAAAAVPGNLTYNPASGTVLNAGAGQALSVTFAPTDTANYNGSTKSIAINVLKATPAISWSNPADITYGTALSGTQLNATASVPGTLTYTPPSGAVLNAGSARTLSVSFAPTDSANYNSTSKDVAINVLKATPVVTWSAPADITYGTPLSATQLSATASVPGSLVYTPNAGTILNAGANQDLSVNLTPTDSVNYNSVSKIVKITVLKATPAISWSNPADISYGTSLGNNELNATAPAAGTFTYTPASGTSPERWRRADVVRQLCANGYGQFQWVVEERYNQCAKSDTGDYLD